MYSRLYDDDTCVYIYSFLVLGVIFVFAKYSKFTVGYKLNFKTEFVDFTLKSISKNV